MASGTRLLCGDSTIASTFTRLLSGPASMVFTDMPYNVDYGNHGGRHRQSRTILNDSLPPPEWETFLRGAAEQLLAHTDGALYSFGVELDPYYCDVIVARWEAFTGEVGVTIENGVEA